MREEDGKKYAEKALVETGTTQGALIEITSGLNENDDLVIDGAKNLKDNDLIVTD